MQRRGARITGPYEKRPGEYYVVAFDSDGGRSTQALEAVTREEAVKETEAKRKRLVPLLNQPEVITVKAAVESYEHYMKVVKRNREKSVAETIRRLKLFFEAEERPGRALTSLTPAWGAKRYEELAALPGRSPDTLVSVDYHRNVLLEARSFLAWCGETARRWLKGNPLQGVKGVGKRRKGKPQLRPDEGVLWRQKAVQLSLAGDEGALAALLLLDGGARPGEIVTRQVRDLVSGAAFVMVDDQEDADWQAKTEKSKRPLGPLPQDMRELLLAHVRGKVGTAYLFPAVRGKRKGGPHDVGWLVDQVKRICRLAKVPEKTAHSMRGLRTTLDLLAGRSVREVQEQRGHEDARTTLGSYAAPGAVEAGQQARYLDMLQRERKEETTCPN